MPRSFDMSVGSPVGVDQILSAYGDDAYWRDRLAAFQDGAATLRSLSVDQDGTTTVGVTARLFGDRLPGLVTKLGRGDLEMVRHETWSRIGGGRVRGQLSVAVGGAPVSAAAEALLSPTPDGSQLDLTATVAVKVPLVGGQIENLIGGRLRNDIADIQHLTSQWIAENR